MYLNRAALHEITSVARHRLSLRRSLTWLVYAILFYSIRGVLGAVRWIDDRLWPEIADQKIERPVFIFGNARSGTTLLHRLMSLDEEHFTSMKLYQSIFCAVCVRRSVEALDRLDRRLPGRPLRRGVKLFNRLVFSGWGGIHEMGIDQAEEDEAVFGLTLMTPSVVLLLPYLDELPGVAAFDTLPAEERRGFMDFYEDTLRRHLHASGGQRAFLNKNALFAPRLRSMFERFPDARFVYLVRHPFDAIPSFLSMFHAKWSSHSPEIGTDSPEARALARLAIDYYRCALDCRKFIPEEQFITVRYDELVANPRDSIEKLYRRLGLAVGEPFRARLEGELAAQESYSSGHRYSLEEFGLCEEEVFGELKDIFTEFGFDPPQRCDDPDVHDFGARATRPRETESVDP
ncbi:MAG: sulfotransferase [Deltaproteobacteria bacterium]|nr:sulfotransferase [Deltaproteobacteria bacterium]MBW2417598.1 sulfotransferase [Deltaproteobacteria bacterium]